MRLASLAVLAAFVALSCEEQFSPTASGERPFVVFAVLSNATDEQIIRVHPTLDPSTRAISLASIPGTIVNVKGPTADILYIDTTISYLTTTGVLDTVTAYRAAGFIPERGATYALVVETPRGNANSSATIPGAADLQSSDYFVLQSPLDYPDYRTINVRITLSEVALGYLARLVVEFEVFENGGWTQKAEEVPQTILERDADLRIVRASYPKMVRRSLRELSEVYGFTNQSYVATLRHILATNSGTQVRFRRAVFVVTQAEPNFFNYYGTANGFQDPYSIRVDKPDYLNIDGALGVFGAFVNDSLSYSLPSDLSP